MLKEAWGGFNFTILRRIDNIKENYRVVGGQSALYVMHICIAVIILFDAR